MLMQPYIHSIQYFFPEHELTNEALSNQFHDWSPSKIEKKTGIQKRYISSSNQCASDLAVEAAAKILYNFDKSDIDYLIFCSESPDYILPPTACLIQDRLGLNTEIGAIDINLGCSGFIYGLGLSKSLIMSGQSKNVLLLTAETYSKFIHPEDKSVRAIFGDGAAATLISSRSGTPSLGQFIYGTDGSGYKSLIIPAGLTRKAHDAPLLGHPSGSITSDFLYMDGPEIFNFTIKIVPQAVSGILKKSCLTLEDIDFFVFHQANAFMLNHLRDKISIPEEKFYINLLHCGNTVSASIPIALKMALDEGRVHPNQRIMLVGFGVGYSWAACIVDWV
jgi:3-oxoacyl-[acyl-carrier-protein] synthase III